MVEKLALGELPAERAAVLRQRLDEAGDGRLAEIERSNAEILREHPPEQVVGAIQRRLARLEHEAPERARPGWLVWAPLAAAAGVALVWWVGREPTLPGTDGQPLDAPPVIAKAEPKLGLGPMEESPSGSISRVIHG
jgi:hypothetical protein